MSLDQFLDVLDGDEFDEKPVGVREFVVSDKFLGLPPLSELQYKIIEASSQIYRRSTLENLYGKEEADRRWKQTFTEVIMQLGKGCQAPETPIFNPESGKWEPLSNADSDGTVISSDGMEHYATEAFVEGYGDMFRVRTALGLEEDVYVGHKYLSYSRSDFYHRSRGRVASYQEVSKLGVGDRIAVAVGFDASSPVNIPVEHAELIGYWLGDGMMPRDGQELVNMDFSANEYESIARYEELCKFIGDTPTKTYHKTKNLIFFRHGRNSKAVALAKEYGLWGMRSKDKFVPDAVWRSDNNIVSATLSKLWQTDGCVYNKNGLTAEFVSVSRQLAIDVQRMLLRLGVPAAIRFRTPKSNFENAAEAGYVTVSSQEAILAFFSAVTPLDHKNIVPTSKNGRVYKRLSDGIYYDRITSIESIGPGEFWTRTVPDTGNYVGNGMVSANSGKDYTSTIACAYIVYLLLCLKDPARYFGKPPGDSIDILNIAINSQQARNVFFKGFKNRLDKSPWFAGKYNPKMDSVEFKKGITVHSGHSERESWEGYNTLLVILDEISGFAIESTTGNEQAKTADAIYKMYRGSVDSRFPDFGKVLLLSFPRYKDDFIQTRYKDVISESSTIQREHTFKVDPELPDGIEGNHFTISWEEDKIISYRYPKVFAMRRPTWEVNPTRSIEDFKVAFMSDPVDAASRFACMPPEAIDAFFKSAEKIRNAFREMNLGVSESGRFADWFKPDDSKQYYIHVDLAQKHDRCAVAMAHIDHWRNQRIMENNNITAPFVVVDTIRYWTPSKDKSVDFTEVKDFILDLKRIGFNIKIVTFDRWNSHDMMEQLKTYGLKSETLSVAKKHYEDMALAIYEDRVRGPHNEILIKELLKLKINKDKVDHPRQGSKDLADATCGAIYNAIAHTPKSLDNVIEVYTGFERMQVDNNQKKGYDESVIRPPRAMPQELESALSRMRTL